MTLEGMVVQQNQLHCGVNKDLEYSIGSGGAWWLDDYEFNVKACQQADGLVRVIDHGYYWPETGPNWSPGLPVEYNRQTGNNNFQCRSWFCGVQQTVTNASDDRLLQPQVEVEVEVEAVSGIAFGGGKRKSAKRRRKKKRDEEVIEKQRTTHIAVERNRRKQMNHYLSLLRSFMPPSYSQRGHQASIVGGAINFVKELEQHLQYLQAQYRHGHLRKEKRRRMEAKDSPSQHTTPPTNTDPAVNIDSQTQSDESTDEDRSSVFSDFFQLPQYSTMSAAGDCYPHDLFGRRRGAADVEVRLVENHANLKVRCRRQPKQLLKLLDGLAALHLTILHLHVTTFDHTVLYCFNVKVEDGCRLSSVDEIATAVHVLMAGIRNQAVFD